jgi:hypothetical protein
MSPRRTARVSSRLGIAALLFVGLAVAPSAPADPIALPQLPVGTLEPTPNYTPSDPLPTVEQFNADIARVKTAPFGWNWSAQGSPSRSAGPIDQQDAEAAVKKIESGRLDANAALGPGSSVLGVPHAQTLVHSTIMASKTVNGKLYQAVCQYEIFTGTPNATRTIELGTAWNCNQPWVRGAVSAAGAGLNNPDGTVALYSLPVRQPIIYIDGSAVNQTVYDKVTYERGFEIQLEDVYGYVSLSVDNPLSSNDNFFGQPSAEGAYASYNCLGANTQHVACEFISDPFTFVPTDNTQCSSGLCTQPQVPDIDELRDIAAAQYEQAVGASLGTAGPIFDATLAGLLAALDGVNVQALDLLDPDLDPVASASSVAPLVTASNTLTVTKPHPRSVSVTTMARPGDVQTVSVGPDPALSNRMTSETIPNGAVFSQPVTDAVSRWRVSGEFRKASMLTAVDGPWRLGALIISPNGQMVPAAMRITGDAVEIAPDGTAPRGSRAVLIVGEFARASAPSASQGCQGFTPVSDGPFLWDMQTTLTPTVTWGLTVQHFARDRMYAAGINVWQEIRIITVNGKRYGSSAPKVRPVDDTVHGAVGPQVGSKPLRYGSILNFEFFFYGYSPRTAASAAGHLDLSCMVKRP